ncbi:MAG: hypothetical protein E7231_13435 [Cellulosilyticum sp.]|nr:hypothetical protein [Cellulosilyticum sp.]
MKPSANIACQPKENHEYKSRHSNDFCIIQLPNDGKLIWHVISQVPQDTEISFNVKEHHTYKEDSLRFIDIKEGSVTPYFPYRNLYIADVKNATGHFVVRVEAYEE